MQHTGTILSNVEEDHKGSFLPSLVKIEQVFKEMSFEAIVDDHRSLGSGELNVVTAHKALTT